MKWITKKLCSAFSGNSFEKEFPSFPKRIFIQTQNLCNGKCSFCPYPSCIPKNTPHKMSDTLFEKILIELKENKEHILNVAPYLMNEPLVDTKIIHRLKSLRNYLPHVELHLLTNGSLISQSMGEELIASPLDWLGISFFGIRKKTYEELTGLSYDQTILRVSDFVKKALDLRGSHFIMITFFLHGSMSREEAQETIEYWKGLGVERISFFERGISRAGNVEGFPSINKKRMNSCKNIWTEESLHIMSNGEIIMCCMDWNKEVSFGSLEEESISDIWTGLKMKEARLFWRGQKPLSKGWICSKCEMSHWEEK